MKFRKKEILPSYEEFKKLINKLDSSSEHQLFYYSLFDPSTWEEEKDKDKQAFISKELEEVKKEVPTIFKKFDKKFFRKFLNSKNREMFFKDFVYSDILARFLIASKLESLGINPKVESLSAREGPDIVLNYRGKIIIIEVKRLSSCSNLRERISDEIVPQINSYLGDKIILLFLFPQIGEENEIRLSKLIDGFYTLEDLIKLKSEKNINLFCEYVKKEYESSSDFSFEKITEKLKKFIEKV